MGDRFKIGGKVYEAEAVDDITLRDLMVFNREAEPFGITWADVERISSEMAALADQGQTHPEVMVMVGVTVWTARRAAGDDVTFEEAVDVKLSDIEWLESPKDRAPKKGKKSSNTRKGSGPAIAAVAPSSLSNVTTPETSVARSEAG